MRSFPRCLLDSQLQLLHLLPVTYIQLPPWHLHLGTWEATNTQYFPRTNSKWQLSSWSLSFFFFFPHPGRPVACTESAELWPLNCQGIPLESFLTHFLTHLSSHIQICQQYLQSNVESDCLLPPPPIQTSHFPPHSKTTSTSSHPYPTPVLSPHLRFAR